MPSRAETNVLRSLYVNQVSANKTIPDAVTETQYARDRLMSAELNLSNPPFLLTKATNRLVDGADTIMRGYIRRSDIDIADATSMYRLYFMYNPAEIQRTYIAYLDQQALDPGNALFGSNNLAAAPGIVDFSFELLFDRQIEVTKDPWNPGTKIDYDYFDLVVRGVVPDSNTTGNAIPDNGVMMVNPNNIVVVFGQDLSVQGRAYNAAVSFEKFTNHMIPTRMRISIAMKVFYIGPVQTIPNYSLYSSERTFAATVPYDETTKFEAVPEQYDEPPPRTVRSSYTNQFASSGEGPTGVSVNGTQAQKDFAHNLLIRLSCPGTAENMNALLAWQRAESGWGNDYNNPLNTTQQMPGSYPVNENNGFPVQGYPSIEVGLEATLITINNGRYNAVIEALQSGTSALAVADAVISSGWGTGELMKTIIREN